MLFRSHVIVSRAITALRDALTREDEGVYFVSNQGWWFGGLAILVLTGIAAAALSDDPQTAGFVLFWLGGWTWGTSFLLIQVFNNWMGVFAGPGSRILNFFGAVFSTLFALPFLAGLVFGIFFLGLAIPLATSIAIMLQGVLAAVLLLRDLSGDRLERHVLATVGVEPYEARVVRPLLPVGRERREERVEPLHRGRGGRDRRRRPRARGLVTRAAGGAQGARRRGGRRHARAP